MLEAEFPMSGSGILPVCATAARLAVQTARASATLSNISLQTLTVNILSTRLP